MRDCIKRLTGITALGLLALAGCGGGGGGGDARQPPPSGMGELTLGLTDAPLEAAEMVVVAFTGFEFFPAGEETPLEPILFDESSCDDFDAVTGTCSIDLLALTGDTRKEVFNGTLPVGEYDHIRLMVDADRDEMDSYIQLIGGEQCPIWVPSGAQTGLKVQGDVTVTTNGVSDYTLDFDVRSSIAVPPGLSFQSAEACDQNYILRPTVRLVDTTETGHIGGTVEEQLLVDFDDEASDVDCNRNVSGVYDNAVVYIFENFDRDDPSNGAFAAVADDIDDGSVNPNPITTATVEYDATNVLYTFEAGFLLAPEEYLVALTCSAGIDTIEDSEFDPADPEATDFRFIAEQVVTTVVDDTVDASF